MKRWIVLFLCLLVLLPCFPAGKAQTRKVVDEADLLTSSEEAELEQKVQALVDKYQMDIVLVTVRSLGGKSYEAYADDYFDYNGYGIGSKRSGVLFLLSMEDRDLYISTSGEAIDALSDRDINGLLSKASDELADNEFYEAFNSYLNALEAKLKVYRRGIWGQLPKMLLIGLLIGVVVGGIVLLVLRSQMRTAKPQSGAKEYIVPGTYALRQRQDVFLYSQVRKVRRSETSSGSGGGTSTHRSSSGRIHGGGHSKF